MIVALHPMGGNPVDFLPTFRRYRPRGRLILPYGHPNGGGYIWYDSVRYDVAATTVTREADRLAAALVAPNGKLLACTNHRGIRLATLRKKLHDAARKAAREVAQMKNLPPPVDFPPPPGEEPHLKSVLVTFR